MENNLIVIHRLKEAIQNLNACKRRLEDALMDFKAISDAAYADGNNSMGNFAIDRLPYFEQMMHLLDNQIQLLNTRAKPILG